MIPSSPNNLLLLRSTNNNPFLNLAFEDSLFEAFKNNQLANKKSIFYLWRNRPTVVIGRHQNPFKECKLPLMERENVHLARRETGGGAVYQDLGNLNFTFISKLMKSPQDIKHHNFNIILQTLEKFQIKAKVSGRNDIVNEKGYKISGSAFKQKDDTFLHHGTLLLNVNLTNLSKYLTPHLEKLQSKGVDSVKARVQNLSDLNKNITTQNMSTELYTQFLKIGNSSFNNDLITNINSLRLDRVQEKYDKLSDWKWRFGTNPQFQYNFEKKFPWGMITIHLESKKGIISFLEIFSDTLFPSVITLLQENLQGIKFHRDNIAKAIEKTREKLQQQQDVPLIIQDIMNDIKQLFLSHLISLGG